MIYQYQTKAIKPEIVIIVQQLCYGLCLVERLSDGAAYHCRDTSLSPLPVDQVIGLRLTGEQL